MNRRHCIAVTLGMVLIGSSPASPSLCGFDDIAIFALNSAHVSRDARVTGDVVANAESPGPVLNDGAEVALDRGSTVTGNVKGHTLHLDPLSAIGGNATYFEIINLGGTITGTQTVASPPYTGVPVFQAASPGGDDVFVGPGQVVVLGDEAFCSQSATACTVNSDCPAGQTCNLSPVTTYGDISIAAGGSLVFSGGRAFDVRSIQSVPGIPQCSFPCRSIEFDAPTALRVAGRIDTGRSSFVGPAAGSGIAASDIVIYAGGANGGTGAPLSTPFAVNIGRQSLVEANVYAPNGTIEIDRDSTATGAFLGRDVEIQTRTVVTAASAFANQAPTAFAQDVQTDGANALVITLEGSDAEGADLDFSIEVDPFEGTLGAISPITPAPVDQCSQSGETCTVDTDCPGFAEGETCETVQPPITQATVTYTPNLNGNCVTDPQSGVVACPPDFFTFGVRDDCDDLGTAIVRVNGGTDEVPDGPGPGVQDVTANDLEIDLVVNQVRVFTLSAAAPTTVASLTFRVETLPSGALEDSNGDPVTAGVDLPSPVVTYQAPAATGSDSFTFSARDSSTTIPPACGPPSCDTGTVNIDIGVLPELAPDQSVETDLNTPVQIELLANPGGAPGGSSATFAAGDVKVTYGDNGPPLTEAQRSRLADGWLKAGPTALGLDQGWFQFSWCDVATSPGCNTLVDLVNESTVIESPFEFTTTVDSCLRVTDTLAKGDHWRVENLVGSSLDWTEFTSEVPQSTVGTTGDPNVAFQSPEYSHGEFDLGAGAFSIRLVTIPPNSFAFGTAGYIRVDTGACIGLEWTITSLPAASTGTLRNLNGSPVTIGTKYFTTPTVVFTPAFNFSGSTSFGYQVKQGGLLGAAVIDSALVNLLIRATDDCILVGREPGCAPGGGSAALGEGPSVEYVSELGADDGPRDGLTLIVEGAGALASSPVPLKDNRVLRGLVCTDVCTKEFPAGSLVGVYARPEPGHELVGWSGACWGEDQIGVVRLGTRTVCQVTFREKLSE